MSKPNATPQKSRLGWIVFGMVAIGSAVYYNVSGDDSTPTKKTTTSSKPKSASGNTDFIPADYTYQFADEKVQPKGDAFQPLVSKLTLGGSGDAGPEDLPGALTGGESWAYTGIVEVNGTSQAVLENQKTSETVFLGVGQLWKKAKVKRVSDSAIELADNNGKVYTVKMSEAAVKNEPAPAAVDANANPNSPAGGPPPPLTGPIGNPSLDVTPLPAAPFGGGGGGGWRNRRGGGRRGGGFGFGGGGGG
jgi:hypothetical protein